MKLFRLSTIISAVLTYLIIFIGGMVRVSGAGMGCPDWPKCFGRWIPPTSLSQIPDYIDPAKFNIVLAWIEYLNRLFGVLVGFSILITFCQFFQSKLSISNPIGDPNVRLDLIPEYIFT